MVNSETLKKIDEVLDFYESRIKGYVRRGEEREVMEGMKVLAEKIISERYRFSSYHNGLSLVFHAGAILKDILNQDYCPTENVFLESMEMQIRQTRLAIQGDNLFRSSLLIDYSDLEALEERLKQESNNYHQDSAR